MPFIAIAVPTIPESHKDASIAAFPAIAAEIKAQPTVAGLSAGAVIGEDSAPVQGFKWLQAIAFKTKGDAETFRDSAWAADMKVKFEERAKAAGLEGKEPPHALFECDEFDAGRKVEPFTQISRTGVKDEAQLAATKASWEKLMKAIGKECWGGKSVDSEDGKVYGLGFVGWASMEEAKAAYEKPEVKKLFDEHKAMGEYKDMLVKLAVY